MLGFAFVPLGHKTALEHTLGIFTTPAAIDAWHELGSATGRLRDKVITTFMPHGTPSSPIEPTGARPEVPTLPTKKPAR